MPNLSTVPNERGPKNKFSSEQASTAPTSLSTPSTRDIPPSSAFSPIHGESSAKSAPKAPNLLEASPMSALTKRRSRSGKCRLENPFRAVVSLHVSAIGTNLMTDLKASHTKPIPSSSTLMRKALSLVHQCCQIFEKVSPTTVKLQDRRSGKKKS